MPDEKEIPAYKVLIAGTIVFIVGLFIFSVIFQAFMVFQEVRQELVVLGNYSETHPTIVILSLIPWGLGIFYIGLVGTVIYFLLKGAKERPPPIYWR